MEVASSKYWASICFLSPVLSRAIFGIKSGFSFCYLGDFVYKNSCEAPVDDHIKLPTRDI